MQLAFIDKAAAVQAFSVTMASKMNKGGRIVRGARTFSIVAGLLLTMAGATHVQAHGFTNCTKAPKSSWKPASAAEAAAKAAGYEVRRSRIEGSCYEVYGVKGGKLFELFYSPADLKLIHTKAK